MKQLQLGKITTRELADWFGISADRYRHTKQQKLEILADYCDFDEIYGGVEIKEIYIDKYDKTLNKCIDKMVLQEIKATHGLMSISGMARKLGLSPQEEKLATQSRIKMFGKFTEESPAKAEGIFGYRKYTWAIKINDQDVYRKLTQEEYDIWSNIIGTYYNKKMTPEEVLIYKAITDYCINNSCSVERYNQMLADNNLDFYGRVIGKFKDQTRLQIVHISEHELEMGEARLRESYPEEAAKIAQYYKAISN